MWFEPPPELPTRIVLRMPDEFRKPRHSDWTATHMAANAKPDAFLEGPCFDGAGNFFCVDIPYGRIHSIVDGQWRLAAEYDGFPNGMKWRDGKFLIADHKRGIVQFDPATGEAIDLLSTARGEGLKGANDLTLHPDGSILFTDQGQTGLHDPTGRVYRLHPDGRLDRLISNGPSPNGLVFNRDGTQLYVAMTRSSQVWRFGVRRDASVTKVANFHQFANAGPDGLAVDEHDRLYVCDPSHGYIFVLHPNGMPAFKIKACIGRATTNCAFAPDGRTLYITESSTSTIIACDVPPP